MAYNPQFKNGKPYIKRQNSDTRFGTIVGKRPSHNPDYVAKNDGYRYPISVIELSNGNHNNLHPTQKPVALFAYLIRTYTNPGDLVLDNSAGSGTTAIAAIQTGRDWLCIEKDADIYATAANRIAKALGQGFTPAARAGQPNNVLQLTPKQRGLWESE